jgi:transposase-like protein
MPQKSRFTVEQKVKVVTEYKGGKLSPSEFERNYGSTPRVLKDWVQLYEMRGTEGLMPSAKWHEYTPKIKRSAVLDYLNGTGSLDEICRKYDISGRRVLRRWIKRYSSHGDFKQPNSGGAVYMTKGRGTTIEERIEIVSYCVSNNNDYGKAIERYGVSYQQIYAWVKKYEKSGPEGLADRRGKRKDEASMTEVERLRAQLKLKEAENLRLQMENELIKKLEALERGWDKD